jgi:hypothetical protein
MRTIKISPSKLNSFARYLDESLEYETLERLLENLTKPFIESPKMRFGKACHMLLENPDKAFKNKSGYNIYNEVISFKEAEPLLEFRSLHPDGIYEHRFKKVYMIRGYEVTMSQMVDFIEFDTVFDFKIVEASPKTEQFMNSFQWKCYLDVTELPTFVYQIWQRRGTKNFKYLSEFDPITLYRFDGLHDEVVMMIEQFIRFLEKMNMVELFDWKK